MPVIEHIEIATGNYPLMRKKKKKNKKLKDTRPAFEALPLIFIITSNKSAKYEYFLPYSEEDLKKLIDHMHNKHDLKFTLKSNFKTRLIVSKFITLFSDEPKFYEVEKFEEVSPPVPPG